jgi:23S rRNA pseudouridine2457 synthase
MHSRFATGFNCSLTIECNADQSPFAPRGNTMTLVIFNKPYGVLCQFRAITGRLTLKDYLPQPDIHAAGRLDADSEGLLVLTDDGREQHRITDPYHKLPKTYYVQVEGVPDETTLAQLRKGVTLNDGLTRPAEAVRVDEPAWLWPRDPPVRFRKNIPTTWIQLTLREGKNRQVRRMTAAVGHPTLRLIRYAIGDWTLDGMTPGQWKHMT